KSRNQWQPGQQQHAHPSCRRPKRSGGVRYRPAGTRGQRAAGSSIRAPSPSRHSRPQGGPFSFSRLLSSGSVRRASAASRNAETRNRWKPGQQPARRPSCRRPKIRRSSLPAGGNRPAYSGGDQPGRRRLRATEGRGAASSALPDYLLPDPVRRAPAAS
ncbi:hypothetical protein HMPREF1207_05596, partial [Paenibacillus sp. HGH0039]